MSHRVFIPATSLIPILLIIIQCVAVNAGEAEAPQRKLVMDYGSFLSASVAESKNPKAQPKGAAKTRQPVIPLFATKGITIKLPGKTPASVCFDTDTLRLAAGWSGGFLNFNDTMLANHKGTDNCVPDGSLAFRSTGLGWGKGTDFSDPRAKNVGPLPKDWAHYRGLYRHGDRVVLSYTVGHAGVLESPACEAIGASITFTRSFNVEKSEGVLTLHLCDVPGSVGSLQDDGHIAVLEGASNTVAALIGAPAGVKLERVSNEIHLTVPAHTAPISFKTALWNGSKSDQPDALAGLKKLPACEDLSAFCKGGPAQWKTLETVGQVGTDQQAYVLDTLTLPDNNPWNAWMRTTGIDFFPDGRAAVCTLNGDVWIVSGIDATLQKLTWTRFATGLFEPLGLKIVDNIVYVAGRDQITRLYDLNGDGEADFYENFNNDTVAHPLYHAFVMDLDTDSQGNFYYSRSGVSVPANFPDNGCVFKVSKDGQKSETVATGFRAVNGMAIGPNDQLVTGDNEGQWMPSSKINFVKPGDFLGYMPHHHLATPPTDFVKPLCWIPHTVDSSSGGQVWAQSAKWGPLTNHYLHTSYGKSLLMLVLNEVVDGTAQAGTIAFPLQFKTGIMRARFNPNDGQLYVCGVGGGWQTNGVKDGAIQRVRYTGKPANMPVELHVLANGVSIVFSDALDKSNAEELENFSVEQWNYKWSEKYGSAELSVANPTEKGHDPVEIKSVKLVGDQTLVIEMPGLKPVMQMQIKYRIKGADGRSMNQSIFNTINAVPAK